MYPLSPTIDVRRSARRGERSMVWSLDWFCNWRSADPRRFTFRDSWRAVGTIEQAAALFLDTTALSRWWPQLMGVRLEATGGSDGAQRTFRSRVRGFLPYELDLDFRVVDVEFPRRFAVELTGDLQGQGGGVLRQEGPEVAIDFDLTLTVARPLLRVLSFIGRPLLAAQHRWVMLQGERGLTSELSRRGETC